MTVDESRSTTICSTSSRPRGSCDELHVGVSTRGALCLYRASQALALVEDRDFVVPDDVKRLAVPVLSHRVIAKGYLQGTHRQTMEALWRGWSTKFALPVSRLLLPATTPQSC